MHRIDPSEKVPPPRVLSGRYRLDSLLARSGGGEVHLATQLGLERKVAVKLISKTEDQDWGELVTRLSREAQVLARLNHVNVVTLHDFGKTEDGDFFLTMEYLDGRPLAELIETQGPFAFDRILRIGVQVARALREAHAVGVIHRDLTAEDVFLVRGADENDRDHVKVINFGLAETAGGKSGLEVVADGDKVLLGSPSYVSPEQICGDRATERSDIYAFGVLMYLMLTGRVPFSGGSQAELQRAHLKDAPPPPSLMGYRRRVPRALEELVYRCLEKEPEDRFSDARSLILALKAVYWAIDPSHSVDGTPKERSISGSMGPRLDPDFGSDDLAAITAELAAAPIPGLPNPTLPPFGPRAPREWTTPNAPLPPPPRAEPPSAPILDDGPLLVPPLDRPPALSKAPAPSAPIQVPTAPSAPLVPAPAPQALPPAPVAGDGPRRFLPLALVGGAVVLGAAMLLLRPAPPSSPTAGLKPPSQEVARPLRPEATAEPELAPPVPAPRELPPPESPQAAPVAPAPAAAAPDDPPPLDRAAADSPSGKRRRARGGTERAPEPEISERPASRKVDEAPVAETKPEKVVPRLEVAPERIAPAVKPEPEVPAPTPPEATKVEAAKPAAPPAAVALDAAPKAPEPKAPAAPAPEPKPAAPAPKAEVLVPAQPIKNVLPSYPERYVSSGYSAVVTLKVTIDEAGVPTGVEVIEPARFPEFNVAAKRAAMAERYRPATRDGQPVPYLRTTRYNFAAP